MVQAVEGSVSNMRLIAWSLAFIFALIPQALAQAERKPAAASQPAASKPSGNQPAANQPAAKTKAKPAKKAAAKSEKPVAVSAAPATPAQREAYAALPVAERIAIQSDLIWTGDLSGSIDPEFGDRAVAAVRSFQKRNKFEESGILTSEQRQMLAASMSSRKEYNGWRLVEDQATPGVRLGVPSRLVPNTEVGAAGSRWSSTRGEIQIETFREKMAGATLQDLFDEMKRRPSNRRVEQNSINTSSFALSGMQGLKKFHVRVYLKDNEARGISILFDQAMETIMLPLVDIIVNSYLPFGDPMTASTSRRVSYGSGIVVTRDGHVVTERQLTDRCHGIIVAGAGRADLLAEDAASDLALIRINGARNLSPLRFSSEPPKSVELTLVGIAEPQTQAGAREVTTTPARLRGIDGARVLLDAQLSRGFVGGAAIDGEGQLAGMIDTAPAAAPAQSAFVPTATIRKFLANAGVKPLEGRSDFQAARNAVVRVICVRK